MNEKVLNLLAQSKIENDLSLPIWIYKIENITVRSRRFLKVYFFNRLFNGVETNQIVVQHQEKKYAIDRFETVSEYQDKNIFGGMVEIPLEDTEEDIVIQKEIVSGKVYQASNRLESFSFAQKPKEDDYLQSKNKAYQKHHEFFPQIHDQWWQCSCGRIHKKDDAICSCGLSLGDMTTIVSFDYEENHIKDALSKGMDLDLTKSFDQNYESYTESLQKYGIASEVWRDRIDADTERQRYNSLLNEKNQKTAKRKKITIIAAVLLLLIGIGFGVYHFTGKNGEYNKAKRLLRSGEYQEAELIFESLEDYKDSKTMILETRYQDALNRIKNGDTGITVTNILASLGNYKDAKDQLNEVNYNNAVEDLNTKKYVPAITIFTKLGDYKDSKSLVLEAKYGYAKMHNNNTDTLTYSYLNDLKKANYKDSKTLYSNLYDWKYKIVINDSESDITTNMSSVDLYKSWYCHLIVSGGIPGASVKLSYEGDFPTIKSLYGEWEGVFYSGNEGCVEFWYTSISSYSNVKGTFTFRVYDSNGKTVASKSVSLR